tara:strand:+ start:116 stop:700 length:585 start_codon:yes stop_codon:yes gene_type:complete
METFIYETMLDDVSLCDALIDYHNNNLEYKSSGEVGKGVDKKVKASTDVFVHVGNKNPMIHMYMQEVMDIVTKYVEKYNLKNMFDLAFKENWNIQHYKPNEGFFGWHCERTFYASHQRALVFMTYLNDVTDGGETEFYWQKVKTKPIKGKTVIWPTDFTHLHRGIPSPTQHKYIATGWMNHFDVLDYVKYVVKK